MRRSQARKQCHEYAMSWNDPRKRCFQVDYRWELSERCAMNDWPVLKRRGSVLACVVYTSRVHLVWPMKRSRCSEEKTVREGLVRSWVVELSSKENYCKCNESEALPCNTCNWATCNSIIIFDSGSQDVEISCGNSDLDSDCLESVWVFTPINLTAFGK